jgi:hypothetical protein
MVFQGLVACLARELEKLNNDSDAEKVTKKDVL